MNWWFTNQAVLLDTAGRLMFEEVKPGETSEWKEFLALLKKNRPNCPINGLFLVIPADSLIKDTADSIQKKAGKIAQQLDVIQRALDVRFPVFVVVTKCDKVNGFREFFDSLTDPQLQHQMTGWSNPDPLDEPFKPEMVDKYLEQVTARLRRRRLGLMRDPVPENPDGRRTDEVDSLYAFPYSLELLGSRLRRYLETIFIAGEWSAKPLFLRGIYFSSAMREGAALDAELAEAIGVSVDQLPEGKIWERERTYFLRDLFLEKVFREKGLVTRASNTKRMLRTHQIALYTSGFLALAVFLAVAWFAKRNLNNTVKDQGDYWGTVKKAGWEGNYWSNSIVPVRKGPSFAHSIFTNSFDVDTKPVTLGEFHAKLRDLASTPLKKNLFFPYLADTYNQKSRKAQRIVFEASIVRPLLDGARQKMESDNRASGSEQGEAVALAALIQLEADILLHHTSTNHPGVLTPEGAEQFLRVFQNYIASSTNVPVDGNLVAVMAWTYSTNDTAKGSWPPRRLSGGRGGGNTLAANVGINAGLELFLRNSPNSIRSYVADWDKISPLRASVKAFFDRERDLFAAAAGGAEAKFVEAQRAVETARRNLEEQLATASSQPLFADGVSLTNAYQKFHLGLTKSPAAALRGVRDTNNAALLANKDYPRDYQLFKEIKDRLDRVEASLSNQVEQLLVRVDIKEFQQLDETCLATNSGARAFVKRAEIYRKAEQLMVETPFAGAKLIGSKGDRLEEFLKKKIDPIRAEAEEYSGGLANDARRVVAYQLRRASNAHVNSFFTNYLAEAKSQLESPESGLGFPLVTNMTWFLELNQFDKAATTLKDITDDLASPVFTNHEPLNRPEWKAFKAGVKGRQDVAKALRRDDGSPGTCTISLAATTQATRLKDGWRGSWRHMKVVFDGGNNGWIRTEEDGKLGLGVVPVHQKINLVLNQNVQAPTPSPDFPIPTPEWGPLWLIHRYKGTKVNKTWLIEFPAVPGLIRLNIEFERELPDLDKWPREK